MSEFLAMDGYGVFVWPAYGLTALLLLGLLAASLAGLRRARRRLAALKAGEEET
jgi:heme exporter protein D